MTDVPEGWMLIPAEPTHEQMNAAWDALKPETQRALSRLSWPGFHALYKIMLSASPSPPDRD